MKLNKLLCGLALVAALGGSTSCAMEETLYGTYTEKAGQYDYTTAVLVTGEAPAISGCKIIKADKKQLVKDYLDNTPGPDGTTVNVKL